MQDNVSEQNLIYIVNLLLRHLGSEKAEIDAVIMAAGYRQCDGCRMILKEKDQTKCLSCSV